MGDRRIKTKGATGGTTRRGLFRIGAAIAAGGLVATRIGLEPRVRSAGPLPKIEVMPTCLKCTGCVAVCPKGAIASVAAGPAITEELCIDCGYCVAVCPVGGLKLNSGGKSE